MARKINKVVIHHSAVTQPDIKKLIASMQRSHKERLSQPADKNGSHVAYHFTIGVDGEIARTRDIESVGWHASNLKINNESIGVCLSGNFDEYQPSEMQYASLAQLLLTELYGLDIHFHREYAKKTCPGTKFDVTKLFTLLQNTMSIFKEIREIEVKEIDRLFKDYKDDNRPMSVQDTKYLLDIAFYRAKDKLLEDVANSLKGLMYKN